MGWSVDEVRRRREELEKEDASKKASAAAKSSVTAAKATGTAKSSGSTGVTAGAPLATGLSTAKSGTAAGSKKTTTATQSLGAKVLAQMDGTQTATATAKTGKKLQTTQQQSQPEWLQTASGTPAAVVRGANENQKAAQKRRSGSEGVLAQGAQAIKDHTVKADAEDKFSDFTRLNRWMDADPKHRTLVSLIRMGKSGVEDAAALGSSTGDNAVKAQKPYTDAELIAKGYSQQQIDEARQYIAEYDALPAAEKAVRRTADTAKGIGGTVAAAVPLAGESLGTALWNIKASADNRKALAAEVEKDPREKKLYDLLQETDMDYKPQHSTEELIAEGYTRSEIDSMRARIAGTEVNEGVDKDESVGYQLYDYGKQRTERAQSGMNPTAQVAMSVGTSAAENLAVAGISPALVLPVLSAQGGAEAMGQSIEKGDSAGKTLVGGLAKFGAGWGINSVGAADLAKTMGEDYAKDTLAGKLADVVRSVADNGTLAQRYPTVANAVSGGIDNAMQAFVETYADKAIDAALGDAQAAEEMFSRDTFLTALESGLSGGASGALGGAVGTQLGRMRMALETAEPSQSPAGDSSPERASLGTERQAAANDRQVGNAARQAEGTALQPQTARVANEMVAEQTAVNDDPAGHTPAQNASIEEYKQSVDPGLAEYVDRVRAGEDLAPYTVTETSDRMRDAMMELTGLDKVGKVTMMDANAVQHITNRHAGGDGSADGTMKESADVARAAYVLNNFDNAYLAKDRADGYMTSKGKHAPIVIFEKKIDGSHVVVEAVCDTKKNKNFIVSEYLAKNGVDGKEIAKALQSPVNAIADPGDNARNVAADPSADTTVTQRAGDVNGRSVENAGETVESREVQQEEPGTMRETVGLQQRGTTEKQNSVQRELQRWKVSEGATKTMSRNMPTGIADESRYAAAASSLYRLGQMEDVKTFDKAMELARGAKNLAVNTDYVLAQPGGEAALKIAWLQGKGELEAGAVQTGTLGGILSDKSMTGSGRVLYKGTMRTASEVATQLIELNARATDTDAVLKAVLEGDERVKGYVDTAAGQIFFADSAGDVFGTVLHEDWHWYNALDTEGAKAVQQHVLEYLAKSEGFENIDELIRGKLTDYAQQGLTYEEAAEELVADAWRGIFDSEESFKSWVEFQHGQAEKNAGRAGTIRKVMNAVKNLLTDIVSRAKEVLAKDPENKAALRAQRLAEAEKRALQEEYFAHAEKAMENLRAAKENAAALENKGAAKERRYEINPEYADDVDQWDKDGRSGNEFFALGSTGDALQGLGAMENDIFMRGSKINLILKEHPEMTLEEIKRIPEILDDPVMILTSQNKGRTKQNTRLVMFGDVKAQDGRPVLCVLDLRPNENGFVINDMQKVTSAYTKDVNPVEFVRKSDVLYVDENKKRTSMLLRTLGFKTPSELQYTGSIGTIAYENQNVKLSGVKFTELEGSAPVKKNVRFQLAAPVEVDNQKDLVAVHNLTEQNLQEALELGGMPSPSIAVVKAQEGHTDYGAISLVFGSETIDPMVNSANRIYGSDAWTPTRPSVEYKVDADKVWELNGELAQLSRQTAEGAFARSNLLTGRMDMEASNKSPQQMAQQLARDDSVKAAYLAEKGETVQKVMKRESRFTDAQKERYEKIVEAVGGEKKLRSILETDEKNGNHEQANAVQEAVRQAEKEFGIRSLHWTEEKAAQMANKLNPPQLLVRIKNALEYVDTKDEGGKLVQDTEAMQQELRQKAPDADVEQWLLPKMEKVLGKKGIYNGKDPYTKTGNRRSFAQLHYAYTLENLVQAMNTQQDARGQGAYGASAKGLMSTATAEYETLDEVRADKDRLQKMPAEEYNKLLEEADSEITDVIKHIRSETAAHAVNSYEEQEIIGSILMQAAQGKRTAAAIGKVFAKEGYIIGKDTAQRILKLYNDVAKIPTGYFEAKPQRAVGFDEVRAAILPDNASGELINTLKEKGVTVELYKAGDDAERTKLLNEVPDVRFQLAEQASRDAKKNEQQQASRVIAEKAAALDTLSQFFGLTRGVTVSRSAVEELAGRWLKANGSKVDQAKLAQETEVLVNYLKADGADMEKAEALAETLAGEIQDGATYRNSELWDEYPELHKLEYTVNKTGKAKAELVKRYGSWSEAVAEARRHGVTLRQAEDVRDGNPAEQYESLVNDNRTVDGTPDGARALWKDAAEKAGVAGSMSMESTEWLDVLMNLHDAIKPKTMSQFADEAEYEDAKQALAGKIIGDIMNLPQLTDAEAIFEGIQRNSLAMAQAAAGSDARAAEVESELKDVQKVQSREFARRLAQNRQAAGKNAEVQQVNRLQRQLDKNLREMGTDVTNMGDLNEKLTVLRESYQREMKAEAKRMKAERQEMLDEARLEVRKLRSENADLARQAKNEQRRADRAEYSLLKQEGEVRERDLLNQQRAAEWYQEQGERLAIERQVMQQQRDEEITIAKRVAEKRVQKARDGRKMDELKRGVRRNAAALNQMILRPSEGKYVSQRLISQAAEVAKLADLTTLNNKAVAQLTRLQNSILASMGSEGNPTAMTTEWKQSGVPEMITTLQNDLEATRDARLRELQEQLTEAEKMPDSERAQALRERIEKRIQETKARDYLPTTVDQMRMLKNITSAALTVIRNENKTVSLAKAEEVSKIAEEAAGEVKQSRGNHPGGTLDGVHNLLTKYNLDMLGAERVLRMLGGYKNGGQMEKIGRMLNDGQYRQTKITVEGEKLFANVTGREHAREARAFAGPGADLVDMGLKDTKGNAVPLTHAQLCSLYMHLQNQDSLQHLMSGGMVVPDAQLYSKGDIEQAYQKGQTVHLGLMEDADGAPVAEIILNRVEEALTDYDRAWCADMKEFFNNYTTKLINETSLQLVGYKRATVKNYFPIEVERSALATQIDGVKLDATIEGRGFLKNRVKSSQPILLEECSSVVQRSLRDTAAYAGLAAPIRDVQKILNAQVETEDGNRTLKGGIIKEQWGTKAVSYLDDLLTDLQTTQRKRSNSVSRMLGALRGNYAGAVLTLNPGVAIAQAASLPTAAAVLGSDTMAAVMPFVRNFSPKQKAALEAEIARHGDVLLQWRQRGSGEGELQSIGKRETPVQKGMDKLPKVLTGWINGMDEITVAALWEGSKTYVKNHAAEFEGAEAADSPAYWEAVNRMYQKVIEQTQPNYTVMQKAGIQRNPDEMVKTFTMFTTQRFQNAGILIDAVGDWKAQSARYKADATEENRAELKRATQQRDRAILSQTAQVAVFALMKIGADFLLHRWDREQDENGDVTLESVTKRFASLSAGSAMGNFLFGSELYNLLDNAIEGKDYDVISATNISAVNDLTSDLLKFTAEMKKDTSEMDEAELEKHHAKLLQKGLAFVEDGFEVAGVPYGNGRKIVEAIKGYAEDAANVAHGGKFSFNSLPESATGQYDRLYNAYASGDADEAQAAVEKLVAMGKEDEIYEQLETRLKKYDPDIEAAAKKTNAGDWEARRDIVNELTDDLQKLLDTKDPNVRDAVVGAVDDVANELLATEKGYDKRASIYVGLRDAVDSWNAEDVQKEYDRLVRAGKSGNTVKGKITEAVKPEYLAGSDADKQRMADMLLALTDADGKALYTEKTFTQWENAAEKAAQEQPEEDPYAALR